MRLVWFSRETAGRYMSSSSGFGAEACDHRLDTSPDRLGISAAASSMPAGPRTSWPVQEAFGEALAEGAGDTVVKPGITLGYLCTTLLPVS